MVALQGDAEGDLEDCLHATGPRMASAEDLTAQALLLQGPLQCDQLLC